MLCAAVVFGNPAYQIIAVTKFTPSEDEPAYNGLNMESQEATWFLFVGHPSELLSYIDVTSYIPRQWLQGLLPVGIVPWFLGLPAKCYHVLNFTLSVSLSLAIINCAPIYMADGSLSLELIIDIVMTYFWNRSMQRYDIAHIAPGGFDSELGGHPQEAPRSKTRSRWIAITVNSCTVLLALNIIASMMMG
jgi:hypothetical protein